MRIKQMRTPQEAGIQQLHPPTPFPNHTCPGPTIVGACARLEQCAISTGSIKRCATTCPPPLLVMCGGFLARGFWALVIRLASRRKLRFWPLVASGILAKMHSRRGLTPTGTVLVLLSVPGALQRRLALALRRAAR